MGRATPTMAKMSMERAHAMPPAIRSGRLPKYLMRGKAETEPARPHMLVMTVMVKGLEMPLTEKK